MEYQHILLEKRESGVVILTLNHPETLNALTLGMANEVIDACARMETDNSVRVLILTGAGRGFSSGGSIDGVNAMRELQTAKVAIETISKMVSTVFHLKMPVICALNGTVAGASIALALASDLILASENASFVFPFSRLGFCPDCGCTYLLTRLIGHRKTAEHVLFGKTLGAVEAKQLGAINEVCAAESLIADAIRWAETLAQGPSMAFEFDKQLLHHAQWPAFDDALQFENACQILACQSGDFAEGISAFIEKRAPVFAGANHTSKE
jgi:2-(1,2-epoxy-1,2-dihydrophenyl)acetyl-CoA isomerase